MGVVRLRRFAREGTLGVWLELEDVKGTSVGSEEKGLWVEDVEEGWCVGGAGGGGDGGFGEDLAGEGIEVLD